MDRATVPAAAPACKKVRDTFRKGEKMIFLWEMFVCWWFTHPGKLTWLVHLTFEKGHENLPSNLQPSFFWGASKCEFSGMFDNPSTPSPHCDLAKDIN